MKIKEYTFEMGRDFNAIVECEFCQHEQPLKGGYHDSFYHTRVIQQIKCKACGKATNETADPAVNGVPA